MTLVDYRTAINSRLWTLLEANTEVTTRVTTANRVDLNKTAGWLRALFQGAQAADFPSITISTGRLINGGFTTTPTFGMNPVTFTAPAANVGWIQERTYGFTITATTDVRKIGDSDELEEAIMLAMLSGGPKMGLAYVIDWKMDGMQQMQTSGVARGSYRLVSALNLTIRMRLDGPAYLA